MVMDKSNIRCRLATHSGVVEALEFDGEFPVQQMRGDSGKGSSGGRNFPEFDGSRGGYEALHLNERSFKKSEKLTRSRYWCRKED